MIRIALVALIAVIAAPSLAIEAPKAEDSRAIQDCVKTSTAQDKDPARCIGIVANPCLETARSTADSNACIDREHAVWDDILNETYRRLRAKLEAKKQAKLRDMQRAWLTARDKGCAFYWDYFEGTMASPMAASCVNRETARRALFLLVFLNDAEGR